MIIYRYQNPALLHLHAYLQTSSTAAPFLVISSYFEQPKNNYDL